MQAVEGQFLILQHDNPAEQQQAALASAR